MSTRNNRERIRRRKLQRRRIFWFGIVPAAVVLILLVMLIHGMVAKLSGNGEEPPVVSTENESAAAGAEEGASQEGVSAGNASGEASAAYVLSPVDPQIAEKLSEMSLHEKVCQLFIVTQEELTDAGSAVTVSGEVTKQRVSEYPIGGVIYFTENLSDANQTTTMIRNIQQYAKDTTGIPMFISVDEEGGVVARCAKALGTTTFQPMYTYRSQGVDVAYQNARTIATDIAQFGFNLDFAPVADTWSNASNTVIGERAYSTDYQEGAQLVARAVEGFHDGENGGVACSLKHFPGHGDTVEDSHEGSAYVNKTLEQLQQEDFLPFVAGINAGADMVMMGHITVSEVDDAPASLSTVFIQDILRSRLGYTGVVITDSLAMGAVDGEYSAAELSLMAFEAGNDILLCTTDLAGSVQAIENAVRSGRLSESRIDDSVTRILNLKRTRGIY